MRSTSVFDSVVQQRLMGYALKTFHDFSTITDRSEINGTPLLNIDLHGRDNALEISLRPLTPEESISFWSAEDRMTTRLSAYYEVRYALLEPELPRRLPGIVLRLGNFIVDIASPQLAGTRSQLTFDLPAIAGGGRQTTEASPARVGPPIAALPESNRLTLLGSGLTTGRTRRIYLGNARWRQRLPGVNRVLLDPSLPANAAAGWAVTENAGQIEIAFGTTLSVAMPPGPAVDLPVEPGIYTVNVEVVKESLVIFGQLKAITDLSSAASFAVIPRVTGAALVDPLQRRIRVDLDPSLDLTPTDPGSPGPLDILFVANGQNYIRHDPAGPGTFDAGDFEPFEQYTRVPRRLRPDGPRRLPAAGHRRRRRKPALLVPGAMTVATGPWRVPPDVAPEAAPPRDRKAGRDRAAPCGAAPGVARHFRHPGNDRRHARSGGAVGTARASRPHPLRQARPR